MQGENLRPDGVASAMRPIGCIQPALSAADEFHAVTPS